eukprot:344352_1
MNFKSNDYTVKLPTLHSEHTRSSTTFQSIHEKKISFLVEKSSNIYNLCSSKYRSIHRCQNKFLRYSLIFYGFVPDTSTRKRLNNICKWIHRLFILLCLTMGFYSIEGITSQNHGSNYLTAMVDFVYPFFYCAALPYFVKSTHFWKICSIGSFVMTNYAQKYITLFLLFGLFISVSVASWQKLVWREQHVHTAVYNIEFIMWLTFYITFIVRIYILFLAAIIFWITARFHQRQAKVYLRNIRQGNANNYANKLTINDDDDVHSNALSLNGNKNENDNEYDHKYDHMLTALISIKTDMNHTNSQIQRYLSVLLITVLISLIVLVSGMLLSFIQITIFINNSSDLFIMGIIAMYILFVAAQTTQRFNGINNELKKYYHQQIAFVNWKPQEIMLFLLYSGREKSGFSLFGVILDYGTVMRFCIILVSSFLSTFGKKFYS